MNDTPQSKGGKARAELLAPEERSRIARTAAQSRWENSPPKAISGAADRPIRIADIQVPCYVLDDGRRVITMGGMVDTLNIARGGSMKRGMSRLELFISGKFIKPFISSDLHERVRNPIRFRIGKTFAYGFDSDTLIDIAEAVIAADNAGELQTQQKGISFQCRVITSSLTRIGLIALIDEATGYQTIYRVYGWSYSQSNRGPRYAGKLIRQLIYEKLPTPVLPELDAKNPSGAKYQRKHRHHQFLTDKIGLEHFKTQVVSVMTLLRASPDKKTFQVLLERVFGEQMSFAFDDDHNA